MTDMTSSAVSRWIGVVTWLLVAPGFAEGQVADEEYGVRAGDRVTVTLYTGAGVEVGQAGGERIVDRQGRIFLPFIGSTTVAGLDQQEIRDLLQEAYTTFYDGHVVQIEVELSVSVTGAVGNAGQYFVPPTSTIVDAISRAGGMQAEIVSSGGLGIPADQSRVRLVRDGETIVLNLRPDEINLEILRMPVQSGDWIHVPYAARSRVRDELQFWGGVLGFVGSLATVVFLLGR